MRRIKAGLCLLSTFVCTILAAQDPRGHRVDSSAAANATKNVLSSRLPDLVAMNDSQISWGSTEVPCLSRIVAVEDLGIRIPEPPATPRYANEHIQALQEEVIPGLVFLSKELDKMYQDQARDIKTLRDNPALGRAGMDSELFKSLKGLPTDGELERAEKKFETDVKAYLLHYMDVKDSADQMLKHLNEFIVASSIHLEPAHGGYETGVSVSAPVSADQIEADRTLRRTSRQIAMAEDDQRFLNKYSQTWKEYRQVFDRYINKVSRLMEIPEKEIPISCLVLARLAKIKVFETYRTLTRGNLLVWSMAANVGYDARPTNEASNSALLSIVQ